MALLKSEDAGALFARVLATKLLEYSKDEKRSKNSRYTYAAVGTWVLEQSAWFATMVDQLAKKEGLIQE